MRIPGWQVGASRSAWLDAAIVAALVVAAIGLWKFRLIDIATLPYRLFHPNSDLYTQIYPMSWRAAESIRSGQLPLWNPFQIGGHPLLATGQYGMLYPLNAVHLVLPTAVALEATVVLHLALCGVFMYAFARAIDLPRLSALLAATAFGCSGFIVNEAVWFPPALASAPWLPLALLAVEKAIRTPRWTWSVVLAVAISFAFLAGWPQTWMYSLYAIVVYALARLASAWWARERAQLSRTLAILVAGAVLAAGAMAVQLFPMMELQGAGPRRFGGLSAAQSTTLAPLSSEWLLKEAFHPLPDRTPIAYVGMVTLLLAALSPLATRRRPHVAAFWTLAFVGGCAALGVDSPLAILVRSIPGMAWFRAPQRALYLFAVSAAVLAAIGLQVLRASERSRRSCTLLAVVASVAATLLWAVPMPVHQRLHLAVGALVAGAIAVSSQRRTRDVLSLVLVALLARDLSHVARNHYVRPYHDVSVFESERTLFDYVQAHQGLDRTYIHSEYEFPEVMAKQGTLRGIYSLTDYEPLSTSRYDRFFHLLESEQTRRPPLVTFTGMLNADPTTPGFGLMELMSVRYIVIGTRHAEVRGLLVQAGWRPVPVPGNGTRYVLYENADVFPRAYVAHATMHVTGESEALAAIAAPRFDPRRQVVLEDASGRAFDDIAEALPITPARVVRYEPTEVVIAAESRGPGWVVLTDTFFPGWRATVDGRPAPIVRANYLFRAVAVDDGPHVVAFEYVPTSFRLGATVTAAALAAMLLLLASEWRARRVTQDSNLRVRSARPSESEPGVEAPRG